MRRILLYIVLLLSVICCTGNGRMRCVYLIDPLCEEDSCEVVDGWCIVDRSYDVDEDYMDEILNHHIWDYEKVDIVSFDAYLPDFVVEYDNCYISGDLHDCELVVSNSRGSRSYDLDVVGRRMLLEELMRLFPDDSYLKEFKKEE